MASTCYLAKCRSNCTVDVPIISYTNLNFALLVCREGSLNAPTVAAEDALDKVLFLDIFLCVRLNPGSISHIHE